MDGTRLGGWLAELDWRLGVGSGTYRFLVMFAMVGGRVDNGNWGCDVTRRGGRVCVCVCGTTVSLFLCFFVLVIEQESFNNSASQSRLIGNVQGCACVFDPCSVTRFRCLFTQPCSC